MLTENVRVNGVWSGARLTALEQMCVRSFQANGHEFHLYVTGPTGDIPPGTIVHKTEEVVPEGSHKWFSNLGHFGDYFRYHAINKLGGWYVDTDTICLKSFDFSEPYVFIAEHPTGGPSFEINLKYLSSCVFKAPAGCDLLKNIIGEIEARDPKKGCNLPWPLSDINLGNGPPMFRKWVPMLGLEKYIKPPIVFDAFNWNDYAKMFNPSFQWIAPVETHAIHLRGSFFRYNNWDPDGHFSENSLYKKWQSMFNGGKKHDGPPIPFLCVYCGMKFESDDDFCAHQCPLCVCRECGKLHHTASDAAFCQRVCGARNRASEERKRRGL